LDTIRERDGQTDGQTEGRTQLGIPDSSFDLLVKVTHGVHSLRPTGPLQQNTEIVSFRHLVPRQQKYSTRQ